MTQRIGTPMQAIKFATTARFSASHFHAFDFLNDWLEGKIEGEELEALTAFCVANPDPSPWRKISDDGGLPEDGDTIIFVLTKASTGFVHVSRIYRKQLVTAFDHATHWMPDNISELQR